MASANMCAAIPASIPRMSLGMAFFANGTSRKRTLRVPDSEFCIYLFRHPRQPYRLTERGPERFLVVEVSLASEIHGYSRAHRRPNHFFVSHAASRLDDSQNSASDEHL